MIDIINIKELIIKDIEGNIELPEKRLLEEVLLTNTEYRKIFEQESKISLLLSQDAVNELNVDLSKSVLNSIDLYKYSIKKSRKISSFWELFSLGYLKYGFAAGCGVVATVLFVILFNFNVKSDAGVSRDELVGLMSSENPGYNLKVENSIPLELEKLTGKLNLIYFKNLALVELDLNAKENLEIELSFDDKILSLQGISPINPGKETNLTTLNGIVRINCINSSKFRLIFQNLNEMPGNLSLKILENSHIIYNYNLAISR